MFYYDRDLRLSQRFAGFDFSQVVICLEMTRSTPKVTKRILSYRVQEHWTPKAERAYTSLQWEPHTSLCLCVQDIKCQVVRFYSPPN